jgi:hypothetical protein
MLGFISVAMVPLPFILERVRYLHSASEPGPLANFLTVWKASTLLEQVRQLDLLGQRLSTGCCGFSAMGEVMRGYDERNNRASVIYLK